MPKLPPIVLLLAFACSPWFAKALGAAPSPGDSAPAANRDWPAASPDEATEMARLQALPASHIPLKGANLASAVRMLAEAARMSYLAPTDVDFGERITSDVVMNPYELLKVLGEQYGVGMEYRGGLWRFHRIDLNELVTKAYTLRFNNLQRVTIRASNINSQLAAASGGMNGGMGGGMGGGAGMGGMSGANASAGASPFSTKADKVIEDIKKIIGLPTVGVSTPGLDDSSAAPGLGSSRKAVDAPKVEPIWNPDTSQLFVVATRQQHSLIASYLKTVDQPQKLIRIAVKFVETARNPTQSLGTDWSQTFLGSGGPITLAGPSTTTNSTPATNTSGTNATTATLGPLSATVNLNHPGSLTLPTALLSAPAFQWTVQAIAADRLSSIVQDPVIYTSNNREVTFKATSQQPIQQGTTTIGSATAATTTSIAYIDVGTEVTILPCILPGRGRYKELVQLNLSINVSSITGQQVINGNPYPVTSSRTYSYSVAVPAGETLAIAGLEERSRQTTDNKVPVFGDIPVVGYAFKNKSDSVIRTTLLAFITPQLISTDEADAPPAEAIVLPAMRHRVFEGSPAETLAQVDKSLDGLPADIAALQAYANAANRNQILNQFDRISVELSLMDVRLGELRLENNRLTGRESALVAADREQLSRARSRVAGTPTAER